MDIRYNFLNTLDHFPCELIRTLWTLQSLDIQRLALDTSHSEDVTNENHERLAMHMSSQSNLLEELVDERIKALKSHREELLELQDIRRRYNVVMKRQKHLSAEAETPLPKLTIKLNLRDRRIRGRGRGRGRGRRRGSAQSQRLQMHKRLEYNNNIQNVKSKVEPLQETYCICKNESFGAMIACDNSNCPIEWFHYSCVGITKPPTGKWYCSDDCKLESSKKERIAKQRRKR